MPITTQRSLFGDRDVSHGTLTINNGELYPYIRLVNALVDEVKLDATDDGFYTRAVDPANVALLEVELGVDHDLPEFTIGTNVAALQSHLGNKKRDATVDLEFSRPFGSLEVSHGNWEIAERVGYQDPSLIRDRPDRDPIEVDLPVIVDIELGPLAAYITDRDRDSHLELRAEDGQLFAGEPTDESDYKAVATTDIDTDESATSMFSLDYLRDMVPALSNIGVDTVTLHLGDDYPMRMEFATENISGTFGLAPRIQK